MIWNSFFIFSKSYKSPKTDFLLALIWRGYIYRAYVSIIPHYPLVSSIGRIYVALFQWEKWNVMKLLTKTFSYPWHIHLFKINNWNTTEMSETCSKLIMKTTRTTDNYFKHFFYCFFCWLWTDICMLAAYHMLCMTHSCQ